jgi:peptidoglycan/xylan/chitin deacetylase (PgdA/CDA1 family)
MDSQWFDQVIETLKSTYNIVSVNSLYEFYLGNNDLKNACHITVDDGDKTFYDHIFPVLKKHHITATLFVSPKICKKEENFWFQEIHGYNQTQLKRIIGNSFNLPANILAKYQVENILKTMPIKTINGIINRYQKANHTSNKNFRNVTLSQLKEIYRSGLVTIGAHTMNHPILTNEDDVGSKYEVRQSIIDLSDLLNTQIQYFAYPNGIPGMDFTAREEQYLEESGVKMAFSTESKNFSKAKRLTNIPRFQVSGNEHLSYIRKKLFFGSVWEPLKRLKRSSEFKERKKINQLFSKMNSEDTKGNINK